MRILVIASLFFINTFAFAQTKTILAGIVKYKDGAAAKDVTVSLFRYTDSVLVQQAYSLDDGKFQFLGLESKAYVLVLTSLAVQKVTIGPILLKAGDVFLDTIYLNQATEQLREVSIKSRKLLIEKSIDKTTINVENTSLAVGNSALDILNRAPGLTVLNDGTIQLNGKTGVTVMLDGKLTYLSAAQLSNLLRSTTSTQIKSIEIMSHPPVKYDASGGAGLINIIMKRKKEYGTNGTLTSEGTIGKFLKANTGVSINERVKHFNIYGNYNYANNKRYGILTLARALDVPGNLSHIDQSGSSTTTNQNHNYKAGIDYEINKNNTVGLAINGYINDQVEVINNESLVSSPADKITSIIALNTADNRYSNSSYNLYYKSIIDTLGQQFDIDINLLNYKNSEEVIYTNKFSDERGNAAMVPVIFRNISQTDLKISALTANYTLPIAVSAKLDFGIKSSVVKTDNNFLVENYADQFWTKDVGQSNVFLYKESINAAYLNISKHLPIFDLQLGVRAEHTATEGNSSTVSSKTRREYLGLFPVISVIRKVNKNSTIGLTGNRRIDRPNYGSLNPFIYYLDLYTYKSGNQYLKPQYTNSLSLNYQLYQKYGVELVYSNTKNVITDVIKPDTKRNALFTMPENLSNQRSLSLSLSVPVSISDILTIYNDLSVYHTLFSSDDVLGSKFRSSQNAMNFKSYFSASLSKSLQVDLSFNYQSKQLYGTSKLKSIFFTDIGSSYKFSGDRLIAKFSVKDVFNQKRQMIYSNLPEVNYSMYDKPETRLFSLGLSCSFGGKSIKPVNKKSTVIEEEIGRVGSIR